MAMDAEQRRALIVAVRPDLGELRQRDDVFPDVLSAVAAAQSGSRIRLRWIFPEPVSWNSSTRYHSVGVFCGDSRSRRWARNSATVGGAVSLFLLGYVVPRFASVYQSFDDLSDLKREVDALYAQRGSAGAGQ